MSWLHLHLALNHIPVLGAPFLLMLLVRGLWKRSRDIERTALWWFAGFAVIAIAVKFTGDFAVEESVAAQKPVPAEIGAHEQAADQATTVVFLLGLVSAVAVFLGRGARPTPRWALVAVAGLAAVTSLLMARTANLGGQASHPELRATTPAGPR